MRKDQKTGQIQHPQMSNPTMINQKTLFLWLSQKHPLLNLSGTIQVDTCLIPSFQLYKFICQIKKKIFSLITKQQPHQSQQTESFFYSQKITFQFDSLFIFTSKLLTRQMPYKVQINIQYESGKDVTKSEAQCVDAFSHFKMYVMNEAIFSASAKNISGTKIIKHLSGFCFQLIQREGNDCHYALKQNDIEGNTSIVMIHIDDIKNQHKVNAMVHALLGFKVEKNKQTFREHHNQTQFSSTKCYHFSV